MAYQYGNAVAIDGGEVEMSAMTGGEVEMSAMTGGDMGVFYPVGSTDYPSLGNKPRINGFTVIGDKLGIDYRLQDLMDSITDQEIDDIIYGGI